MGTANALLAAFLGLVDIQSGQNQDGGHHHNDDEIAHSLFLGGDSLAALCAQITDVAHHGGNGDQAGQEARTKAAGYTRKPMV